MCNVVVFVYECRHRLMVRKFCDHNNPVLCTGEKLHVEKNERFYECAECEEFKTRRDLRYRGLSEDDPNNDPYGYIPRNEDRRSA